MVKDSDKPLQKSNDNATRQQPAYRDGIEPFSEIPFSLNGLLRGGVLTVISLILVVSVYHALEVFRQLGLFIKDPGSARQAVADIGEMIAADQLTLQFGDTTPLGPLLAFLLMIVLYLVWLYVPAKLITICSRILLATLKDSTESKTRSSKQT